MPAERVLAEAERQGATPYDIPDVELGHKGPLCSFDALMEKYGLHGSDPVLNRLALIMRGQTRRRKTDARVPRLDAIAGGAADGEWRPREARS